MVSGVRPLVALLVVAGCVLSVAWRQAGATIDPANVAFGFVDTTGLNLLALRNDSGRIPAARASSMATALCSEGREFQIRYVHFQKGSPSSNGRQSDGNFVHDEGQLFEIVQGRAEPDDTCLLVPAGYLEAFPVSRNEFPKADREARQSAYYKKLIEADSKKQPLDLSSFHALTAFAKQNLGRIEQAKSRTAKVYWLLHRTGSSQEVAAIEFSPVEDSLLGSLVLVEQDRLSFFDMPASLKKGRENGGCWRVDDDCRFNQNEMNVPAVLGKAGGQLIFFTAQGAEGQAIVLCQAKDGKLVEIARAYRYQAPI